MALVRFSNISKRRFFLLIMSSLLVPFIVSYNASTKSLQRTRSHSHPRGCRDVGIMPRSASAVHSVVTYMISSGPGDVGTSSAAYHHMLKQRASSDGLVFLASVDSSYIDLAINLYVTSFQKFKIDNYLFVGSDAAVCNTLKQFDIACLDYIHDPDGKIATGFYSSAFRRKTHLKTKIILEALLLGLEVVIVDVDVVFLQNPIPFFKCKGCDIDISTDILTVNSGFYLARPTPGSIQLHNITCHQGLAKPDISNQLTLDSILLRMQKNHTLKVYKLNSKTFTNGKVYFEDGERMFKGDNPCENCVTMHNNYIVSIAAKIYRFKEYGLWDNDRNGYFSNATVKYLTFHVPRDYGEGSTLQMEIEAIRCAFVLGAILKRIVILPRLHCYGCRLHPLCGEKERRCHIGSFFQMDTFDKTLKGLYRENVFLSHAKVPKSIKESTSPYHFIDTPFSRKQVAALPEDVRLLTPRNQEMATVDEVKAWLGESPYAVLRFHSLYHGVVHDESISSVVAILNKLQNVFVASDYRQYKGFRPSRR